MPSKPSPRRARRRRCARASACPGRRSIDIGGPHRRRRRRARAPRRRARWALPNARPSSTCCTASGSSTNRPPKSMPRCSRRRPTSARRARSIACSPRPTKCASAAPRRAIRPMPPPSSWRRARIRSGPGTSPSSRARSPYLYYSLYVILDLFSRYVVGWMVARHENAHLAERLIAAKASWNVYSIFGTEGSSG